MTSVQEALRRMGLQHEELSRSHLARALDMSRECNRLIEVSADFSRRASAPRQPKRPLDPELVWREWATKGFDPAVLDARQVKALCLSPEMATRPEFITALQRDPSPLCRTGCLMGAIFSYFAKWGEIRQQGELEALIIDALRAYSRRNLLILQYRENAHLLFSPQAADLLGCRAVEKRHGLKSDLALLHISLASKLAISALSSFARQFRLLQSPLTETDSSQRLKFATQEVLVPELPLSDFRAVIAGLILGEWVEGRPAIRDALTDYVLHHKQLGDPRLQPKNWAGIEDAATAKFLQWIARESIAFFFNHILPDNSANERRKNFWLQYLRVIKDFQVALSSRDYSRLYAQSRLTDVPGFGRVDHQTTSAFIMRFGVPGGDDLVIVEFSETGNAAHVFSASAFEKSAGKLRKERFSFRKLKHLANENRILHLADWEWGARNKLANWGVRQ